MALSAYLSKKTFILCCSGAGIILLLGLGGCAGLTPPPEPETAIPPPEIIEKPDGRGQAPDSRMLAAHSLTREGYRLLMENNFNGAIRVLERAVGVNPANGPGYYYLAEAWLGKENFDLAFQFNRLASIYLRNDKGWSGLVLSQQKRIDGRFPYSAPTLVE